MDVSREAAERVNLAKPRALMAERFSPDDLDRPRPESYAHIFAENRWLAAVQQNRKEFDPAISNSPLASLHVIERGANLFPLLLQEQT